MVQNEREFHNQLKASHTSIYETDAPIHSKKMSVNVTLRECKWTHSGPFALSQSYINTQDFTVYQPLHSVVKKVLKFFT